ncbi:MAG: hypothetical protein Q8898_01950 [Bacillota bacterium]|nr:hypothetical protein [Bacillota bacterium]
MREILIKLIIGAASGYLFIMWLPVKSTLDIGMFFVDLVVYPIKFLAASIAFTVALIVNGSLMKEIMINTLRDMKSETSIRKETLLCYSVIFNFTFLFHVGWIQALVFLCFTLVYVMISLYF